ncbi:hypothetical protein FQU23_004475 [Flavobacterium sp. XN-5]|uniref:cyclophilin-like fold protein n=1 Tax=Flavobacterium sp. XN-5 TaxID=2599390 RepID=UPI0011CBA09F|nr:cyclophilin-like fold protein [Flavobacterium sp. XN-5]NGY36766.1 hypothetical protein [Flavobacterium sp. XN-5]
MKHSLLIILTFVSVLFSSASTCNKEDEPAAIENSTPMTNGKIKITVNSKIFTATLLDNNSAKVFKEMLPLKINMNELNGNEKYYDFTNNLPANASNLGTIKNGDLMLYGSKTLVLFYQSFSTSYSYTKLGSVDDTTGLATALGSRKVTITFEVT